MLSTMIPGMDEEGEADTLSGPAAGGTGRTSSDEDAGPSALHGAEERGQQKGQGDHTLQEICQLVTTTIGH